MAKADDFTAEMDMTPMIDVTFQLLIFFIVTLKFKLLEKKLNSYLPTDFGTSVKPQIVDEKFITIKLVQAEDGPRTMMDRRTKFFIETEQISGATEQQILDQIYKKIVAFRNVEKDAKAKIHPTLGVPTERVVNVLDLFHKAQYSQITFVGLDANEKINNQWQENIRKRLAAGK